MKLANGSTNKVIIPEEYYIPIMMFAVATVLFLLLMAPTLFSVVFDGAENVVRAINCCQKCNP